MADSHTIPSKFNSSAGQLNAPTGAKIYITAILISSSLTIDGVNIGNPGPVSFSSPILCSSVNTSLIGQIAYFVQ